MPSSLRQRGSTLLCFKKKYIINPGKFLLKCCEAGGNVIEDGNVAKLGNGRCAGQNLTAFG